MLPVIGTKELIAWLPTLLGLGADDLVVVPELAYPTYDVGARLAGAQVLYADSLTQLGPQTPALVFVNSPSNPTGQVLGVDHLRKLVGWARERGALVASDECYLGLGWDAAAGVGPASVGLRRRPHRSAGGALAVQELLAGRLPGRLRRRRRRGGRRAAGGAQTRRDDGAHAGAGGHGRRAGRRRPRARAARALPPPPGRCCCRRSGRPASPSTIPRRGCICGSPAASRAATPSPGSRSAGSWRRPASSTARAVPGMSGWR